MKFNKKTAIMAALMAMAIGLASNSPAVGQVEQTEGGFAIVPYASSSTMEDPNVMVLIANSGYMKQNAMPEKGGGVVTTCLGEPVTIPDCGDHNCTEGEDDASDDRYCPQDCWHRIEASKRVHYVLDAMAGTRVPRYYNEDESMPLYGPHWLRADEIYDTYVEGEHWVLDLLEPYLVHGFRLSKKTDNSGYEPNIAGAYFVFQKPGDISAANGDTVNADLNNARVTFDQYMRDRCEADSGNIPCYYDADIYYALKQSTVLTPGTLYLSDGSTLVGRDIWTYTDSSTGAQAYEDLLTLYWDYEETGNLGGANVPTDAIVPVYYVPADKNATWTIPAGAVAVVNTSGDGIGDGLCYGSKNMNECYKPTDILSTSYFVFYSDLDTTLASSALEVQNNLSNFAQWHTNNGEPEYYCPVGSYEIFGDGPYNQWKFNVKEKQKIDVPVSDGNVNPVTVYTVAAGSTAGCTYIGVGGVSGSTLVANLLDKLSHANERESAAGNNEFTIEATGTDDTRLDNYLRETLSSDPQMGATWDPATDTHWGNTFGISDPYWGGWFRRLYYDQLYAGMPGIMDLFPDINYGLSQYYSSNTCGSDADFPAGSSKCYGMNLLFNVTSYAEFPAYQNMGITKTGQNKLIQNRLKRPTVFYETGNMNNHEFMASAMHHAYMYFFNDMHELSGGAFVNSAKTDIAHAYDFHENPATEAAVPDSYEDSMFFDLQFLTPDGSPDDHIIQGDPYYINQCRRNYLIMLTGSRDQSEQSPPGSDCSGGNKELEQCTLAFWAAQLALNTGGEAASPYDSNNWPDMASPTCGDQSNPCGVKTFVVSFGSQLSDDECASALAITSQTKIDDEDTVLAPFEAYTPGMLMQALIDVFKAIMAGQYTRAAPEVSITREGGLILTTWFEVDTKSPFWRGHMEAYYLDGDSTFFLFDVADKIDDEENGMSIASRNLLTRIDGQTDLVDLTTAHTYPDFQTDLGLNETEAQNIVDIIIGNGGKVADGSKENNEELGAIFRSQPNLVRGPSTISNLRFPYYSAFAQYYKDRTPIAYVGTLHGLLHAFNADISLYTTINGDTTSPLGDEVFAYLPDGPKRFLSYMEDGIQIAGVDAPPVVADVLPSDGDTGTDWRTVLVSGLGNGGTSYFALDITEVGYGSTDTPEFMWNYTHDDLGFTWSRPRVRPIRFDDGNTVEDTWGVFFGGGTRAKPEDKTLFNKGGYTFHVVEALEGTDLVEPFYMYDFRQYTSDMEDDLNTMDFDTVTGENYKNYNQVPGSPLVLDLDTDGRYDTAYVGDWQGKLWKFVFADPDPDNWEYCLFHDMTDMDYDADINDTGTLSSLARRPIWYAPQAAYGPDLELLIYYGTGHIETEESTTDENQLNYVHALYDADDFGQCSYGEPITAVAGDSIAFPLQLEPGEKLITDFLVLEERLYFKTWKPQAIEACATGEARFWTLNYLSGTRVYATPYVSTSTSGITAAGGKVFGSSDPEASGDDTRSSPANLAIYNLEVATPMLWGEGISF